MILALISFALTLIRGIILIQLALPTSSHLFSRLTFTLPTGIGFTWALDSLLLLGWMLVIGSINQSFLIVEVVWTGLIIGGYCYLQKTSYFENLSIDRETETPALSGHTYYWVLNGITFLVIGIAGVFFLYKSLITGPDGAFDASAIWNMRARILLASGEGWKASFELMQLYMSPWTHADYPLLLPNTIARYWGFLEKHVTLVPSFVSFLYTFMTVLLLYGGLALLKNRLHALLAVLALCSSRFIEYGTWQYADVPLAFYILATLVLLNLLRNYSTPPIGGFVLAGMSIGFAAWTKNEGMLFIIAAFSAYGCAHFLPKFQIRSIKQELTPLMIGFLSILLGIAYFKYALAPQNDVISSENLVATLQKLLDKDRHILIFDRFQILLKILFPGYLLLYLGIGGFMLYVQKESGFFQFSLVSLCLILSYFYLFLLPFFLATCLIARILPVDRAHYRSAIMSTLTLSLMLMGYFCIYLITPYDLGWHIGTSMDRLIIQLLPSMIFVIFLISVPFNFELQRIPKTLVYSGTVVILILIPYGTYHFFWMPYPASGDLTLHEADGKQTVLPFNLEADGNFHKITVPIPPDRVWDKISIGIGLKLGRTLEMDTVRVLDAQETVLQHIDFQTFAREQWEMFNTQLSQTYRIHAQGISELKMLNTDSPIRQQLLKSGLTLLSFDDDLLDQLATLQGNLFHSKQDFHDALNATVQKDWRYRAIFRKIFRVPQYELIESPFLTLLSPQFGITTISILSPPLSLANVHSIEIVLRIN